MSGLSEDVTWGDVVRNETLEQIRSIIEANTSHDLTNSSVLQGPYEKVGEGSYGFVFTDKNFENTRDVFKLVIQESSEYQNGDWFRKSQEIYTSTCERDIIPRPKNVEINYTCYIQHPLSKNQVIAWIFTMAYMDCTLCQYMNRAKNKNQIKQCLEQVEQHMRDLQSLGFTYWDLKPQNIMLNVDANDTITQVKLIDIDAAFTLTRNDVRIVDWNRLCEFNMKICMAYIYLCVYSRTGYVVPMSTLLPAYSQLSFVNESKIKLGFEHPVFQCTYRRDDAYISLGDIATRLPSLDATLTCDEGLINEVHEGDSKLLDMISTQLFYISRISNNAGEKIISIPIWQPKKSRGEYLQNDRLMTYDEWLDEMEFRRVQDCVNRVSYLWMHYIFTSVLKRRVLTKKIEDFDEQVIGPDVRDYAELDLENARNFGMVYADPRHKIEAIRAKCDDGGLLWYGSRFNDTASLSKCEMEKWAIRKNILATLRFSRPQKATEKDPGFQFLKRLLGCLDVHGVMSNELAEYARLSQHFNERGDFDDVTNFLHDQCREDMLVDPDSNGIVVAALISLYRYSHKNGIEKMKNVIHLCATPTRRRLLDHLFRHYDEHGKEVVHFCMDYFQGFENMLDSDSIMLLYACFSGDVHDVQRRVSVPTLTEKFIQLLKNPEQRPPTGPYAATIAVAVLISLNDHSVTQGGEEVLEKIKNVVHLCATPMHRRLLGQIFQEPRWVGNMEHTEQLLLKKGLIARAQYDEEHRDDEHKQLVQFCIKHFPDFESMLDSFVTVSSVNENMMTIVFLYTCVRGNVNEQQVWELTRGFMQLLKTKPEQWPAWCKGSLKSLRPYATL